MKLIEALSLKGTPAEIPNCSRDDLPEFFKQMGFKTGAEIGVYKGEFSEKFCTAGLKLFAIDPWKFFPDYDEVPNQKWYDSIYAQATKRLSDYPTCTIVRKNSMEAVKDFSDESLDFVYIDGNHQLRYVIEDLVEWSKKVRPGGIICGHDYIYTNPRTKAGICDVIYAVNAFTKAYKIGNWYLLGKKHPEDGEKRDKFRSFMWVKPKYNELGR